MKLDNIGITIATRELDLDGKEKVLIKIGMPQEFPEGGSFFCPYRILGIGRGKVRYAGGVDPVQAVELALKCIATDLYTSPEFKADRLRHLGMRILDFPLSMRSAIWCPTINDCNQPPATGADSSVSAR